MRVFKKEIIAASASKLTMFCRLWAATHLFLYFASISLFYTLLWGLFCVLRVLFVPFDKITGLLSKHWCHSTGEKDQFVREMKSILLMNILLFNWSVIPAVVITTFQSVDEIENIYEQRKSSGGYNVLKLTLTWIRKFLFFLAVMSNWAYR